MAIRRRTARRSRGSRAIVVVGLLVAGAVLAWWGLTHRGPNLTPDEAILTAKQAVIQVRNAEKIEPRVTPYEINPVFINNQLQITGVVGSAAIHQALMNVIRRDVGRNVVDQLRELPDPSLAPKNEAVVNVPVLNLGDSPTYDKGDHMVTQAVLGNVVELLEASNGWFRVRMHDDYLGWVDGNSIVRMDKNAVAEFTSGQQAVITAKSTPVYSSADTTGANLLAREAVQGTILPISSLSPGWVAVKLPDGREGWIPADRARVAASLANAFPKGEAQGIIATAEQYIGLPYLWGGTTSYGFDCSGLTQFAYRMNGFSLPRDADMQYAAGTEVAGRDVLQPGDLVFFSTYKTGPSHVGIYIGAGRYIQSGGSSGIKICSFDPKAPDYSADLDKKYLGARRFIK